MSVKMGMVGMFALCVATHAHAGRPELVSPAAIQSAIAAGAPEVAVNAAADYLEAHADNFPNKNYLTIIDFTRHSGERRFFLIDLRTNTTSALLTAHGKNSDADNDGFATRFSNVQDSKMSSLGFMKVAETFQGNHGLSIRLDGLESRNDKARVRGIIIHGASYVSGDLKQMGRSWGCPAVEQRLVSGLAQKIKQGSLLYAYVDGIDSTQDTGKPEPKSGRTQRVDESDAPDGGE